MAAGYQAGTAYVLIVPSFRGFNDAVRRDATRAAGTAGKSAGGAMGTGMAAGLGASRTRSRISGAAGRAASGAAASTAAAGARAGSGFASRLASGISRGAGAATGIVSGMAGRMSASMAAAGATAGTGFLASMRATLGPLAAIFAPAAIVGAGFGRLANIEDAQAKLEGLGHTGETVERVMENALAAVKGTAFGLDAAVGAAAGLLAAGVKPGEDLQRILGLVGDSATIAGTSFQEMGAIWNKVAAGGIIQGEEIAQLSDRGIPILQLLGEQMGVTALEAKEMASEGKVSFEDFAAAMESQLAGAALKSGATTRGALANLRAALSRFGATLMERIFPMIRDGATALIGVVDRAANGVGPIFDRLSTFFRENAAWLKPLAVAVAGATAAFVALKAILLPVKVAIAAVNAVMAANPITLVVVAIGALVAAVIYAYKNFETFREVVDTAWAAIRLAVALAWEGYIKPAFEAIRSWIQDVLVPATLSFWKDVVVPAWKGIWGAIKTAWEGYIAPALRELWGFLQDYVIPTILWLWENVVVPAFKGIAATIKTAWERVVQPVLKALWAFITDVVGPVVMWLWENVIVPAFKGIAFAVEVAWNAVKLQLDALIWFFQNAVAPVVRWLWENVFSPVFGWIGDVVKTTWETIIRPALDALGRFIGDTVAPAFSAGVDAIGSAWSKIQEIARKPVNFVIDTVYNNGIRKAFDSIAKAVGSDARLPYANPIGAGPPVTAAPSYRSASRHVTARAKGGWTPPGWTLVGEEGPELVDFRSPGRVYTADDTLQMLGGDGPVLGGISWEGIKGAIATARDWVLGNLKRAAGALLNPIKTLMPSIGGGTVLGPILRAMVSRGIDQVLGWAGKEDEKGELAGGAFARHAGGWPPRRRGVLSANTAAAVAFVRRTFGLTNIGTLGNRSNKSDHPYGKALDVMIPGWNTAAGLARGNRVASWFVQNPARFGTKYVIWNDQINSGSGWRPYVHPSGNTTNPTLRHKDHPHISLFDRGGMWEPGTLGINLGRKPEPVFSPGDWKQVRAAALSGGAGSGPLDLSDDSIEAIAEAMLAGADRVAQRTARRTAVLQRQGVTR